VKRSTALYTTHTLSQGRTAGFIRHAALAIAVAHNLFLLLLSLLQVVKLNKGQRALLLSDEGQVAAAFMKELVTINTQLKAPPCQ
jgi:hypothetical protein